MSSGRRNPQSNHPVAVCNTSIYSLIRKWDWRRHCYEKHLMKTDWNHRYSSKVHFTEHRTSIQRSSNTRTPNSIKYAFFSCGSKLHLARHFLNPVGLSRVSVSQIREPHTRNTRHVIHTVLAHLRSELHDRIRDDDDNSSHNRSWFEETAVDETAEHSVNNVNAENDSGPYHITTLWGQTTLDSRKPSFGFHCSKKLTFISWPRRASETHTYREL